MNQPSNSTSMIDGASMWNFVQKGKQIGKIFFIRELKLKNEYHKKAPPAETLPSIHRHSTSVRRYFT